MIHKAEYFTTQNWEQPQFNNNIVKSHIKEN